MGRLRTLDEIRNWALLSPEKQWNMVAELEVRQKGRSNSEI
jgi:predicted Fe-S protein YdhL (DUF1289 family)